MLWFWMWDCQFVVAYDLLVIEVIEGLLTKLRTNSLTLRSGPRWIMVHRVLIVVSTVMLATTGRLTIPWSIILRPAIATNNCSSTLQYVLL
jgi:phage-related holin